MICSFHQQHCNGHGREHNGTGWKQTETKEIIITNCYVGELIIGKSN